MDDGGRNCFLVHLLEEADVLMVVHVGRAHSEMEANLRGRQPRQQHQIQAEIPEDIQVVDRLVILLEV